MSKKTDEERAAYVLREFDSIPGREYRENFLAYQFGVVRYEASKAAAPAGPLTAEECSAFAERCRKLESEKVSLVSDAMRACYSLDMLALQLEDANAPAWTGPQPVVETTVDKGTD